VGAGTAGTWVFTAGAALWIRSPLEAQSHRALCLWQGFVPERIVSAVPGLPGTSISKDQGSIVTAIRRPHALHRALHNQRERCSEAVRASSAAGTMRAARETALELDPPEERVRSWSRYTSQWARPSLDLPHAMPDGSRRVTARLPLASRDRTT
jgi:hypothetical protein